MMLKRACACVITHVQERKFPDVVELSHSFLHSDSPNDSLSAKASLLNKLEDGIPHSCKLDQTLLDLGGSATRHELSREQRSDLSLAQCRE